MNRVFYVLFLVLGLVVMPYATSSDAQASLDQASVVTFNEDGADDAADAGEADAAGDADEAEADEAEGDDEAADTQEEAEGDDDGDETSDEAAE